jgi:hypothetical protein
VRSTRPIDPPHEPHGPASVNQGVAISANGTIRRARGRASLHVVGDIRVASPLHHRRRGHRQNEDSPLPVQASTGTQSLAHNPGPRLNHCRHPRPPERANSYRSAAGHSARTAASLPVLTTALLRCSPLPTRWCWSLPTQSSGTYWNRNCFFCTGYQYTLFLSAKHFLSLIN